VAIPTEDQTTESTIRALVSRVFTVFSMPTIVVSDNGSSFVSTLMEAFQKFVGFRHVRVLPYNPTANGIAEKSVGRISTLLVRHCYALKEWHKALPLVTYALNSTIHSSIDKSPYFAVFGRSPTGIPELEDPALDRNASTGSEFVDNLRSRLIKVWDAVRASSRAVKLELIKRQEKSVGRFISAANPSAPGHVRQGDYVLLRHGSHDQARGRRKHGFPSSRRFRVTGVLPESHAVRIDTRRTGICDVVSLRHCVKAPDSFWIFDDGSPRSGVTDGLPPTMAIARGDPAEVGGQVDSDDGHDVDSDDDPESATPASSTAHRRVYIVDNVLEARQRKGKWEYLIQWLNYPDMTWETTAKLSDAGDTVKVQMEQARRTSSKRPSDAPPLGTDDAAVDAAASQDGEPTVPTVDPAPAVVAAPAVPPGETFWNMPSTRRSPVARIRSMHTLSSTAAVSESDYYARLAPLRALFSARLHLAQYE
jgi:hypothetical protein